jgi:hypothetical protein
MGRHHRNRKNRKEKNAQQPTTSLFSFFEESLGALASIFDTSKAYKRKKHYRVYKDN